MTKYSICFLEDELRDVSEKIADAVQLEARLETSTCLLDDECSQEYAHDILKSEGVILIIGRGWMSALEPLANDPASLALLLLQDLLVADIPLIPVLLEGASLPEPDALPTTLCDLSRMFARKINLGEQFSSDISLLVRQLSNARNSLNAPRLKQKVSAESAPSAPGVELDAKAISCSIFSPLSVKASDSFLVQTCVHWADEQDLVAAEANRADPAAVHRSSLLNRQIANGATVRAVIETLGLKTPAQEESIIWMGERDWMYFTLMIPEEMEGRRFNVSIRIYLDDMPAGKCVFSVDCGSNTSEPEVIGWKKYKEVFISYSRNDIEHALNGAQLLKAIGISVFQDVLELKPGDRWERKLYEHIDECDLFVLYWSKKASRSKYVLSEANYAAKLNSETGKPDIIPYILEGPPAVLPPQELAGFNFFDPTRCINEAHRPKRSWLRGS